MTNVAELLATPVSDVDLQHYGIKGMKWGVRRKNPSGKSSSSKSDKPADSKKTPSFSGKLVALPRKKPVTKPIQKKEITLKPEPKKNKPLSELTDTELRDKISRLELEQRYSQLTETPKAEKRKSEGRKAAERVIINLASNTAQSYGQHLINKGIQSIDPSYKPGSSKKK